jgi:hypothetical protein
MKFLARKSAANFDRKIILFSYGALLLAIVAITVLGGWIALDFTGLKLADRAAVLADVIACSTLMLALIAALIALQAYATATGLPDLRIQVWFSYSLKNRPGFRATLADDGSFMTQAPPEQTVATISVRNISDYSAKNPAVIIRLLAMSCCAVDQSDGWVVIDRAADGGATVLQWDGGPMFCVHGGSVRRLPALNLIHVRHVREWGEPLLKVELLADGGYKRTAVLPVDFIQDNDVLDGDMSRHVSSVAPPTDRRHLEWA